MRVISMVPSWTETLLVAGVNVVGRTRFCIHPREAIRAIPAVGGTKDWDWNKILELKPDLLVLDKEENPKMMAEQSEIPFIATHVSCIENVSTELRSLSRALNNVELLKTASDWEAIVERQLANSWSYQQDLPGVVEWGRRPTVPVTQVIYVIWKDPWMAVSRATFIGSVLSYCGLGGLVEFYSVNYPVLSLETVANKNSTLLMFSSEPFPFLKRRQGLDELGFPYAFVDGEKFSWFGVRSLCFLQSIV